MKLTRITVLAFLGLLIVSSCKKDNPPPPPVQGCMDSLSLNYNPLATESDGSCQYAAKYLPLKTGNNWILRDTVQVVIIGSVPVEVSYTITGDTVINGKTYSVTDERIVASTFVNQLTTYAYRFEAQTGKMYRYNLTAGDTLEKLFLEYPLELGKSWYDTPQQDGFLFSVVGMSIVTVPAGVFNNCVQLQVTDLATSTPSLLYFGKEAGPVKAELNYEVQGLGTIVIQPVLVEYHLY